MVCLEGCFGFILRQHPDLMESRCQVYCCKILSTSNFIKEFIYNWQWELVLYCDVI
jgi:hypothetical protein